MSGKRGACLVCGKPLLYYENAREMECSICHKKFENNVSCEDDIMCVMFVTASVGLK